jgi:DNA-3-methyladenine glycosylase
VRPLPTSFYEREVVALARALLGQWLVRDGVGGPIVETEAYHSREAACHAHRGPTERNASMFLPGGTLYVYRIHQSVCCADPAELGAAVLIRALRPELGREQIEARRGERPERIWTNGPGKVCQALGITLEDDGSCLRRGPVRLCAGEKRGRVVAGPRIGISKAQELPWRFRLVSD